MRLLGGPTGLGTSAARVQDLAPPRRQDEPRSGNATHQRFHLPVPARIDPAAAWARRDHDESTRTTVQVGYPAGWFRPADPSLYAPATVAAHAFMESFGLLDTEAARSREERLQTGREVADAYPDAEPWRLAELACFNSLWFALDDVVEGTVPSGAAEALRAAIMGEGQPADGGHMRAWWEVGRKFERGMSRTALTLFADRFKAWMCSVDDETAMHRQYGATPPLADYWDVRAHTVGLIPLWDLIPFAYGRDLPSGIYHDPHMAELHRLACLLATIDNDLHGIDKDATAGWHNSVFSMAAENGITWGEAAGELSRLHDRWVTRYETVERQLLARYGAQVGWWLVEARQVLSGLLWWQANVTRWTGESTTPDGPVTVKVSLPPYTSGLMPGLTAPAV